MMAILSSCHINISVRLGPKFTLNGSSKRRTLVNWFKYLRQGALWAEYFCRFGKSSLDFLV